MEGQKNKNLSKWLTRKRILLSSLLFSLLLLCFAMYWFSYQNNLAYLSIIASVLLITVFFYFLVREIRRTNKISEILRVQQDFMKVTLKSIGEGLITTCNNGRITYMNPAAEKLTGWMKGEVLNKPLQDVYNIVNEETGLPFENIVSRIIREGKAVELENNTILSTKQNEKLIISNNGSPLLDSQGKVIGTVLVFNDITEKKKIEEVLLENEKQFRNMIENIPEAVYTCDNLGFIQVYNKAAVRLWGREPLIGKEKWSGSWKILNTEGFELNIENSPMAMAIREKRPVLGKEILIQRKDGSIRHVLPSPTPLFNADGKLTGAVNMLFDITDKIEREILIKKTEEKYKNLFEQASDAIFTYTFDGIIHEFNDIICEISGYTKEEFSKLSISDILIGELIISKEKYEAILAGNLVTLYRQFKRKDGVLVEMEIKTRMIADGKILGMGRDITERKRNEEEIQRANERFNILAKATSDTVWDWNITDNTILYNSGITSMFGYLLTEINTAAGWWKNNIHPEDKDIVARILNMVFRSQKQNIQLEYRYRCADNSYKNIFDRAFVVYNEAGSPVRMIGAMQDVTREKQHERELAMAIVEAQEKERQEMGMELHDNVNQLLSATLLYLGLAKKASNDGKEVSATIDDCVRYINEAIGEIRGLSHRLAPYTNGEVSLKDVIELLIKTVNKTNHFEINLQIDDLTDSLIDRDIHTSLYRIIQEQLTNIIKHADAKKIDILVNVNRDHLQLLIRDDGKGFNQQLISDGIGLSNIKRRAEMFSGTLAIITSPGAGCEIKVQIPIR